MTMAQSDRDRIGSDSETKETEGETEEHRFRYCDIATPKIFWRVDQQDLHIDQQIWW